ncbi:MAG TPA: Hsp20/alpha crystallin family protein [Amnibacterium sp.]|jgi:HSP20 family protein|uniref:Hsp20/alpha crystallin family protein n=1 Tax=Amnibacterium sp. TaxID=1872496 RepID=UPI002F92B92B
MPRNLIRFDPLAELANLQKQFFEDGLIGPLRTQRRPAIDVYTEDDSSMTVEAHLPDFDRNDISVDIDGDALVLQAERHEREEDRTKQYVVRETSSSLYRRIVLPEQADRDAISADFHDGVLKIVVPFTELPKPRRVQVGGSGQAA